MEETISLKAALAIIDKKDKEGNAYPFDITFRSLQRNSKTGGKLYEYKQVKKIRAKVDNLKTKSSLRFSSTKTHFLIKEVQTQVIAKKNPNHFENRTRNLELQNGKPRKIHIRLIISINGKKVIY